MRKDILSQPVPSARPQEGEGKEGGGGRKGETENQSSQHALLQPSLCQRNTVVTYFRAELVKTCQFQRRPTPEQCRDSHRSLPHAALCKAELALLLCANRTGEIPLVRVVCIVCLSVTKGLAHKTRDIDTRARAQTHTHTYTIACAMSVLE